eukprot:TRINITY_DN34130_c0_g1_i1.p2 TRINITY_DN34130_c0_g1~~TRINITY_DN34130_c0_g1_i1.p2  ORF type:complete len:253 (-),score=41.58 TRINITY_DN34130_c0_g1_i1:484-1242(-)
MKFASRVIVQRVMALSIVVFVAFVGPTLGAAAVGAVGAPAATVEADEAPGLPQPDDFDAGLSEQQQLATMAHCLGAARTFSHMQTGQADQPVKVQILQEQWYTDKKTSGTLTTEERVQHIEFSMAFACYQNVLLDHTSSIDENTLVDHRLFEPPGQASVRNVALRSRHKMLFRDADLPAGWKTTRDPSSSRIYYYHVETRETRWGHPKLEPELPELWRSATDPTTGRTYYWNLETQQTTWDHPGGLREFEEL